MTSGKRASRQGPPANSSVRTLILGIDRSGTIVQHDRTAPAILGADLLSMHLSDITAEAHETRQAASDADGASGLRELARPRARSATRDAVAQLLDAVKNEREALLS